MTDRIRLAILVLGAIFVLAMVNLQIFGKEAIVRDGRTVLLRLAPVDPRSLIQGDYMALRYAMTGEVAAAARDAGMNDGIAVVRIDANCEASFVGLYDGQQRASDEVLLRFRKRGESVRLASDAFFFEEGEWQTYEDARFGVLRVGENGDAVLIGLQDDAWWLGGPDSQDFSC
jgi:uncharacterized membrane-anchored protein